ncbi:NAD-dependent epimerase/dehydratase family protein [Sphingoaurantiacus capsulatus]|uniref:NAD-dependent epimerase/dehydratase family protein n=1 Tax=Sphingoaurantiacus capsulatus TaxID=1771310 RepID=A0ABV7XB94_9SPHN
MATLAVTGGTGFVGQRLLKLAVERGHKVRALTRRPQDASDGIDWISGDLSGCGDLCGGVDAIIHVAGVINARTPAEFDAGNVAGTQVMIDAAKAAGIRRFVHVSSLAAREPALSGYGASKARSEALFPASDLDFAIVRPPAVYGPGDRETLELFRMAKHGLALVPWAGHASFIHADDLAAALLALATRDATGMYEPDDGHPGGYEHGDLARRIGTAVGKRPLVLRAPKAAMLVGAAVDTAISNVRGRLPKLSFDRARYFAHPDWVSRGPAIPGWSPAVSIDKGLAMTAAWYRDAGWL